MQASEAQAEMNRAIKSSQRRKALLLMTSAKRELETSGMPSMAMRLTALINDLQSEVAK